MNSLEKKIVDLLKTDARMSTADIALFLKADSGDVEKAIESLESRRIILGYTALVDEEKIDKNFVEALIEVRVTPKSSKGFDEIAAEIERFDEVRSLYLMSGAYDLCIIIKGSTLKEVAMFVSEKLSCLDDVLSTATHFILKKYKMDGISVKSENNQRLVVQP